MKIRSLYYPTCNHKRPEITSALLPSQTSGDRPDIVCRVFNLKLKRIMDEIRKGKIFGLTTAFVCTIEFEKRRLSHAHLLLILHQSCKVKEPADVDRIVCAEIPSLITRPNLYGAVAMHIMHGSCAWVSQTLRAWKITFISRIFPESSIGQQRYCMMLFLCIDEERRQSLLSRKEWHSTIAS